MAYLHHPPEAPGAALPEQEQLKGEVLDMAKRCAVAGFNLLVIDTENQACAALPAFTLSCMQRPLPCKVPV